MLTAEQLADAKAELLSYAGRHSQRTGRSLEELWEAAPVIEDLDKKMLEVVQANLDNFDMSYWHHLGDELVGKVGRAGTYFELQQLQALISEPTGCGTTHCIAGWTCVLAKQPELEQRFDAWWLAAAIYLKSTGSRPEFFGSDLDAFYELWGRAGTVGDIPDEIHRKLQARE